jgi:hypothetical protein
MVFVSNKGSSGGTHGGLLFDPMPYMAALGFLHLFWF